MCSVPSSLKPIARVFTPNLNPLNPLGPVAPGGSVLPNPLDSLGIGKALGINIDELNRYLGDPANILGLNEPKMPKGLETPDTVMDTFSRTPTEADPSAALAAAEERRRRQAAKGGGATILTGALGASGAANTQKKSLLG